MSFAKPSFQRALETGEVSALPSRRDEDWRWTDLRGLLRALPPAAPIRLERLIVPPGERRELELTFAAAPGEASLSRVAIEVGEGAELSLTERQRATGDSLASIELSITVAAGAAVRRLVLAEDGEETVSVSRAAISLAPGARLDQTVITDGARRQRLETQVHNSGGGASSRMDGLYLLSGKRHSDITTITDHAGPGGDSEQLIKGVVSDQARAVFQGRIIVARGADATAAHMAHRALVLSDRAEVDAKPELEIYADDVVCNHGNAIGALDPAAMFYARQRGLSEARARALLIAAFLGEVTDRMPKHGAREAARAWVAARLEPLA